MIRKIKALGLAIAAVAAMSLAGAAAAQGAELHAASGGATTVIEGVQTTQHVLRITPPNGPAVTCSQAFFAGAAAKTSQELTMTGQYTGCTAFGQVANVAMNGCKYTITGAGKLALSAQVDIVGCTSGKQIEIQTAICQITVPEQSTIAGLVIFSNAGGLPVPAHINASIGLSGIAYQLHGVVCGHAVTTTTNDATYQGNATFKAYNYLQTGTVFHNGHVATSYTPIQLQQVALTAT